MALDQVLIEFQQVFKYFGDNQVLRGLDLSVRRGETLTIMGGSGTGKSVLLKLLVGILKPEAGAILYVLATQGNTLKVTARRPA